MKKIFILLVFLTPLSMMGQNVAINNNGAAPDGSAMLDIQSTTKGLLVPRMSTVERTSIMGPAIGLLVFDTNTFSHWMYRGDINGGWAELQHNYQNYWTPSGINMYNNNAGFVGIGTNNPGDKLTINGTNPSIQMMNGGSPKGFLNTTGTDLRLGTYANNNTGHLALGTKGVDHLFMDPLGQIGIGTSTPSSELTINGSYPYIQMNHNDFNTGFLQASNTNLKLGTSSTNATGNLVLSTRLFDRLTIDEDGHVGIGTNTPTTALALNGDDPVFQIKNLNSDKGFIKVIDSDFKIGTNSNNLGNLTLQTRSVDRMTFDDNGHVGIGTTSPSTSLTINGDDPILQFRNLESNKGFVQLVGSDIKIGTNSGNVGQFVVRTNGDDRLTVDQNGIAIIGNSTSGGVYVDSNNPFVGFKDGGLTYGYFKYDGVTGNLEIEKTLTGNGRIILNANQGVGSSLFINENGQFNFGSGLHPAGYKVSVEGKVIATDFVTMPIANWPDYVFGKDYQMMKLHDLKKFIEVNHHLPNIPDAEEIGKNGIELGSMTKSLTEKVEELTLYILQLHEEIETLKKSK